jgi:hypothetical protein
MTNDSEEVAQTSSAVQQKELADFFIEGLGMPGLTLPDDEHTVSQTRQRTPVIEVPLNIPFQLGLPVLSVAPWHTPIATLRVLMPEASMNQDDHFMTAEDDVGLAWQFSIMKPEPQPPCVKCPAHQNFRLCILCPDAPHIFTSRPLCKRIRHLDFSGGPYKLTSRVDLSGRKGNGTQDRSSPAFTSG